MKTAEQHLQDWSDKFEDPPKLNQADSWLAGLVAAVLLVMAILQVVSFTDFKGSLGGLGLSTPETWALVLIVAEVWAAVGFLRLKLHGLIRFFSAVFAVFVAGFWFVQSLQVVSSGAELANQGFFGKYLTQTPGWWTVIEASLLLFATLHILNRSKR